LTHPKTFMAHPHYISATKSTFLQLAAGHHFKPRFGKANPHFSMMTLYFGPSVRPFLIMPSANAMLCARKVRVRPLHHQHRQSWQP